MNTNEVLDLITQETRKDYIAYSCGQLSREEMNEKLIERRKFLSLIL